MIDKLATVKPKIQEIRADNRSGAAEITKRASDVFAEFSKIKISKEKEFLTLLHQVSRELIDSQPSMAPIINLVNRVLVKVEELTDLKAMREGVQAEAQSFVKDMNTGLGNITSSSLNVIKNLKSTPSILTHSYSSTVFNVLADARKAGLEFTVTCTESRPASEGKRLAKTLAGEDIPVTYIIDMLAFSLIKEGKVDLILIGGDSISTDGLINKIGTLGLAVFAKQSNVPIYALLGNEKFLSPQLVQYLRIEPREPEEVLITYEKGINVVNRYFDITPPSFLTGIITNSGILNENEVKEKSESEKVSNQLLSWLTSS
ncbi:MAG TPA: hypothetical protein VLB01_00995 [Thermodesulfobacteriota bacterium]|nr:hypothetical protein [Thermodesulfobacteriota bacterium]